MEILSNFGSIYCLVAFIIGAMFMLATLCIVAISKDKESRNKVHFYVARDKDGRLFLYLGKPLRGNIGFYSNFNCYSNSFKLLGLNENDYDDLKWEDEPIEVFINLED